jgi:hypothetical protein
MRGLFLQQFLGETRCEGRHRSEGATAEFAMRSVVCSLTKINHCAWAEQAQASKDEPTKEELLSRAEAAFTGGQRAERPSGLRRNHHWNNRGARKLGVGRLVPETERPIVGPGHSSS